MLGNSRRKYLLTNSGIKTYFTSEPVGASAREVHGISFTSQAFTNGAWRGGALRTNPTFGLQQAHRTFTTQLGRSSATKRRRLAGKLSMRASKAATPRNKRRDLRQHRQHRLHERCLFSDPSKDGLIASRPTMLTVLTVFSTLVLTLIILVPVRPSRENVISMPSVRRNVCARRSRPARARGFFAHAVPLELSVRARSAHKRKRSDALPARPSALASGRSCLPAPSGKHRICACLEQK